MRRPNNQEQSKTRPEAGGVVYAGPFEGREVHMEEELSDGHVISHMCSQSKGILHCSFLFLFLFIFVSFKPNF